MSEIVFGGQKYTGKELNAEESAKLSRDVFDLLAYGNSFLNDLFRANAANIVGAAQVAKSKLDAPFAGIMAGDNEICVQLIRPGHLMRTTDTTETPANDWTFTVTADGDYLVGYSTNNTTAAHVDKDNVLLILGVQFTQGANPIIEELLIQIGQTTYPVFVIRSAWPADNVNRIRACRLPPLLVEPRQTILVQPYSILAGVQELVFVGLSFSLGRFARSASYSAVSL